MSIYKITPSPTIVESSTAAQDNIDNLIAKDQTQHQLSQLQLLNARIEEAFQTGIDLTDIEQETF